MGKGNSQLRRNMEDSDSYISRFSGVMIATNKYNKGHTQKASFEKNIMV